MFELVFLGTSASRPTAARGLPGLMVLHESERFLVDCGEGTQRQLILSGLGYRRLERVFLTHSHLDHTLGLGGLFAAFGEWPEARTLTVYGGAHVIDVVRALAEQVVLPETEGRLAIDFVTLTPGLEIPCRSVKVRTVPVRHRGEPCFGFLFEELEHRPFSEEKARALGIPEGPARHSLAQGEAVTLADGRRIAPDEVLGPPEPGTRLLVIGDTEEIESLVEPARGVDGLVIEATFLEHERERAREYGHITAAEAAQLAGRAHVGALYLSHISGRYQGDEILAEARRYFPNCQVANDLDRFRVTRRASTA